jgi:hypothetical protein
MQLSIQFHNKTYKTSFVIYTENNDSMDSTETRS